MTTIIARGFRVTILPLTLAGGTRAGASIRYTATELGPDNDYSLDSETGVVKNAAGTGSYIFHPVRTYGPPSPTIDSHPRSPQPSATALPTAAATPTRRCWGGLPISGGPRTRGLLDHPDPAPSHCPIRTQLQPPSWPDRTHPGVGKPWVGIATGAGNFMDRMIQMQGINSEGQVAALYSTFQSEAVGSHPRWYPEPTVYGSKTGESTNPLQSFDGSDRYNDYGLLVYGFDQEGRLLLRVAVVGSTTKGDHELSDPSGYRTILLTPAGLPLEAPAPEPTTLAVLALARRRG